MTPCSVSRPTQRDVLYDGMMAGFSLVPLGPMIGSRLQKMSGEFMISFPLEMDFGNELENTRRTRALIDAEGLGGAIRVPRCYDELSDARVLVMERLDGTTVASLAESKAGGVSEEAAKSVLRVALEREAVAARRCVHLRHAQRRAQLRGCPFEPRRIRETRKSRDRDSPILPPRASQVFKKCSEHKLANTLALKGVCRAHPIAPPPRVARASPHLVADRRLRAPAACPSPLGPEDEPVSRSFPSRR